MAYKNILVHVKTNEEWSPHVDYGFGIAAHFAARIVGMAIFDDIAMLRNYANRESRFGHERMAQRAVEDQAAHNEKVTAALKRKFAAAARERGLSHGFVAAEGQLLRMLPWAARLHDLTILEPMGAYGRPRMSELLLGGATRHVFRNARRPALMNH